MANKNSKNKDFLSNPVTWVLLFIAGAILVAVVTFCAIKVMRWIDKSDDSVPTTASVDQNHQFQEGEVEPSDTPDIALDQGLIITEMGKYAGKYMEDGSNAEVSDVMMLIVKNTNVQDLQLARVHIAYDDFTAVFQITNLPAGESVVVLEQNKHGFVDKDYTDIQTKDVVFFPESMSLREDMFTISGSTGNIEIKNISSTDVTGDIYVYYKNSSSDLLYGGITYRVKVSGGLKAGESKSVAASHYGPKGCKFLMVNFGG